MAYHERAVSADELERTLCLHACRLCVRLRAELEPW